jgi:CRP-like cAMP-binding protein
MAADRIARTRNRVSTSAQVTSSGRAVYNEILLGLPAKESARLFPKLDYVSLPTPTILNEAGRPIRFAFFINSGLASILRVMEDGKSIEVGLCGKEGVIGMSVAAGFSSSANRVLMQVAGSGFRIKARDLLPALKSCPALAKTFQRFSLELALQSEQVAACNRLHDVEERLARWLLMSQDRLGGTLVPLTQNFLAHMLGTRRASVTVAAGILQKAGLIKYSRGKVTIEDRAKLEEAACECYGVIVQQSNRWRKEVGGGDRES